MKLLSLLSFSLLSSSLALGNLLPRANVAARQYPGAPPPPSSTPPPSSGSSNSNANLTGDFQCGRTMCVSAVVNGSTVEYTLSANRRAGWMAMGWGRRMVGSPMVVMWFNEDGSSTLSQRTASAYALPAVDSSPPRVATLSEAKSSVTSSNTKLVFSVEANGDTTEQVIYALGSDAPSSSSEDARFSQHIDQGTFTLNLAKSSSDNSGSPSSSSGSIPLSSREQIIVAHAVFCTVGFLVLLPAGALLARYLRTFSPSWFKGHWIIQFGFAGLIILIGVILGISAVAQGSNLHFNDDHKRLGLGIFVLYILQCSLGAFIHFVKDKNRTKRPPQNYAHAVIGLLTIALAIYQVRSGFDDEWPKATGRGEVNNAVDIVWIIWTVLLPLLYFGGLAFLPKQWRQEGQSRYTTRDRDDMNQLRMGKLSN